MMLTPKQYEVARLCATGLPRPEAARRLGISPRTVDIHMRRVFKRFGIHSRRELARHLLECEIGSNRGGVPNRMGLQPGAPVAINGGRFAGRTGEYVGHANSTQVRIRIGGGVFALAWKYVEPLEHQEAA